MILIILINADLDVVVIDDVGVSEQSWVILAGAGAGGGVAIRAEVAGATTGTNGTVTLLSSRDAALAVRPLNDLVNLAIQIVGGSSLGCQPGRG